jgi:hypothetical protein
MGYFIQIIPSGTTVVEDLTNAIDSEGLVTCVTLGFTSAGISKGSGADITPAELFLRLILISPYSNLNSENSGDSSTNRMISNKS